jgi:hypothetical protein
MTPDLAPLSVHLSGSGQRGISSEYRSIERATVDFLDGFVKQNATRPEIIHIR